MARTTTTTTNPTPASRRHGSRRAARLVQAAIVMGVLFAAGARVMAAPVGPINVPAATAGATTAIDYGIDGRGLVDRVVVHRTDGEGALPATVELADAEGRALASVTAVLSEGDTVVALPTAVDPSRVGRASIRA